MSVVLIGNVGKKTGEVNGQTYRTRLVMEELTRRLPDRSIELVDTSYMALRPLRTLSDMKRGFKKADVLIMMPGKRGLFVFSYFLARWQKLLPKPVYFLVVGGWLPEYLSQHGRVRHFCAGLARLYVQIPSMAHALENQGLRNVEVVPNFRRFERGAQFCSGDRGEPLLLKTFFYSRVIREKGIEYAMEAVRLANQNLRHVRVTLDIFGPVDGAYRKRFVALLPKYPEHCYHGVLPPTNPHQTLQGYDLMLFPTYYEGEGFPGAVVDAFVGGVPVIASDWRYNREVIEDWRTGLLVAVHDVVGLANKIVQVAADRDLLHRMRHNAWNAAQSYHTDSVFPRLLRSMALA